MSSGSDIQQDYRSAAADTSASVEQRVHIRAYHVWARHVRKGCFPILDDVLADGAADFRDRSLCIDVTAGVDLPNLTHVGDELARYLPDPSAIIDFTEIPGRSLVSRMTDHYLEIIANRAPVAFEAEFTDDRDRMFQYRCILLPCSYSGSEIDVILGVMGWRELGAVRDAAAVSVGRDDAFVSNSSGPDDVRKEGGSIVTKGGRKPMSIDANLQECMEIDGAITVALVDHQSGMALATAGNSRALNLEVAAAGNTNVVRAKMQTIKDLALKDEIEDILITLSSQYHLIRPCASETGKGLFIYLVLDKVRANLAMARFKLGKVEKGLTV